jgi:hypothetical protein
MKINAKPGQIIIPVRAESCESCAFYNGAYCSIHGLDRECSDFTDQFGGYVFKVLESSKDDIGVRGNGMGEIEKTLERLNTVLIGSGFPAAYLQGLYKDSDTWKQGILIELRFDESGEYITPEGGTY